MGTRILSFGAERVLQEDQNGGEDSKEERSSLAVLKVNKEVEEEGGPTAQLDPEPEKFLWQVLASQ